MEWRDGNPTIVIDLQAPEEIAAVSAHVPGRGDGGRSVRGSLHVSTSLDGHDWQPVATVAGELLANDQSPRAYVTAQFDARTRRFVKPVFQQRGGLLTDEIEILAAGPLQ